MNRDELIEMPKSTYSQTVLWAQAIHRARSDLDGLMWTSRQCDPDQCIILFEDRVTGMIERFIITTRIILASNVLLAFLGTWTTLKVAGDVGSTEGTVCWLGSRPVAMSRWDGSCGDLGHSAGGGSSALR